MKKALFSVAVFGVILVLLIPLMGFSSNAKGPNKIKPNEITLESGGIAVPHVADPSIYHKPVDGIISGAIGCQPDVHEFDKGATYEEGVYDHIVFTAGISEIPTQDEALALGDDVKIYVQITSNGQGVIEQEFYLHPTPDPNTGNPFWVSAIHLGGEKNNLNLPTGEYNYKFKAKDKKGRVLDVWVPKNHKFTIIDSSVNN